ncbi:MAG: PAS domain S-box protein [Deltaproteobacteria bacterium]|nr:PAS domain S-box protein [Deltaproteobacteria bacterium]
MKNDHKTKKELIDELTESRSQNAALEKSTAEGISVELAAEEARRYAESIVETVRSPLLVLDTDLKIISANRYFYTIFNVIPSETLGCFIYDLGNKQWDIPLLRELLEEILPEKETFDDFEVVHDFQDIGHKVMLLNARQVYRKDVDAGMILLAIEDITDRKRQEALLTESEERYRRLFETANDGIVLLEKGEGKITHANPAAEKMLGYTTKDSLGNKLKDIGVLLDLGDFQTTMQILNKNGIIKYDDVPVKTKAGQHIDTDIYLVDRAKLVQCNIRDITEHKRAEQEALRESEELFRSYLEYAPDGVYAADLEGNFLYGNLKCEEIIGYGREELIGRNFLELNILPEKSLNKAAQLLQANMEGKSTGPDEIELVSKEGRHIPVEISTSVVHNKGQRIVLAFVRDITERKQAEEALRKSEEKFRWVLDNMADVITVMDMNLGFTYVSPSIMRLRGYTVEEAVAQTFEQVMTPESLQISAKVFEEEMTLEAGGTADPNRIRIVEVEQYRKDGSIVWMENHLSFMRDEAQKPVGIISVSHDITDRKRAEAEMERLTTAIEQVREMIVITDPEGTIQYVNPAFESVTGYSRQEAMGQNLRMLKSGKQDHTFYQNLWNTIASGKTWEGRMVNKRKDGKLFTEDALISPVLDTSGRILNYVAVKRDITEKLGLEEQFNQAQKMESIGRLTGGVAHDFNNLLTTIIGNADLLRSELDKESPLHEYMTDISDAAKRAANLTRQLLTFSRNQILQPEVVDLNEAVSDMKNMLRRIVRENIELTTVLAPELGKVMTDIGQIEQVIMNLVVNACDAMPEGGKLTIETADVELDERYARTHLAVTPGPHVMLAVSDTGCGMSSEILDQVFEPFFTTKEKGKGTGLGLPTVYGIVKQSKGDIRVYSEPGKGTSFKIYLPRVDRDVEREKKKAVSQASPGGSETILVVEDEEQVRNLAVTILTGYGYRVLTAGNGPEAVETAEGHEGPIHLLLTDVVMPGGMNGRELADALTGLRPEMKVLFMSGYTDNAIGHHGDLDAGVNFLQKPFTSDALSRKVREALDTED